MLLRFSRQIVDQPITSQIILEKKTPINILSARMNQLGGEILAEIPGDKAQEVIKAFKSKGVIVDVASLIEKDDDLCIDCGACISLCPMDALGFTEDKSVTLDAKKCNGATCGLCVDACTRRALRLLS
ncbi:MAG: 4Fe-4S binding protein [Candidatus Bathyarchaeota archaeon]|nr:4Fe-4S binding protein [Candidatus Bathyarchaeota archaeon]